MIGLTIVACVLFYLAGFCGSVAREHENEGNVEEMIFTRWVHRGLVLMATVCVVLALVLQ